MAVSTYYDAILIVSTNKTAVNQKMIEEAGEISDCTPIMSTGLNAEITSAYPNRRIVLGSLLELTKTARAEGWKHILVLASKWRGKAYVRLLKKYGFQSYVFSDFLKKPRFNWFARKIRLFSWSLSRGTGSKSFFNALKTTLF
ncbi:MAG: hypothetical protein WC458_04145 [Patescibacteria group bacterium]